MSTPSTKQGSGQPAVAVPCQLAELAYALRLLCRVHTRPDDIAKFSVVYGAIPEWSIDPDAYIRAWDTVWNACGGSE